MDCECRRKALAPLLAMAPSLQPRFAAVIVAAGKGLRAGQPLPKQFAEWRGKPLVRHAAEAMIAAGGGPIVVAIPDGAMGPANDALAGLQGIKLVVGGSTRQQSVRAALEALSVAGPQVVLIHDAARPHCPQEVVDRLLLAVADHGGAIPVLPVVDSLAVAQNGQMAGRADRETLRRVQTPQAFRYDDILVAHRAWLGEPSAGDDARLP